MGSSPILPEDPDPGHSPAQEDHDAGLAGLEPLWLAEDSAPPSLSAAHQLAYAVQARRVTVLPAAH